MNLLEEKWLPIRRTNGSLDWIAPHQITEPDIVSLAANRPDFNGALIQFLIGLLQTTTPIDSEKEWRQLFNTPPSSDTVMQWFDPVTNAFVLDGEGARFMQDFSLKLGEADIKEISLLFMDAPGVSTQKDNKDLFVKSGQINGICFHCAATTLFTLQTNAPEGGQGNYTSLRGGGPLTTLMVTTPSRSLWHNLWLNVMPKSVFLRQQGGDVTKIAPNFTFSWLSDIGDIQPQGQETYPVQVHPHYVFWAMPRRIRLDLSNIKIGQCDICKRQCMNLIQSYISRPKGLKHNGWEHPFTPYYKTNKGEFPVRPSQGAFSYKNWLAWVLGVTEAGKQINAASIVNYFLEHRQDRQVSAQYRLASFGYEMDSMKACCWYETTFPLYNLLDVNRDTQENVQQLVKGWIEAAEQVTRYLLDAIKEAWFPKRNGKPDMRGDLSFVDKAFWDSTEAEFYGQLRDLLAHAQSTGIDMDDEAFIIGIGTKWHNALVKQALDIFDKDIVGAGAIDQQNPQRIAKAYHGLRMNLHGKTLKSILRLPVADKKDKPEKGNKVTKAKAPQLKQPPQPDGQLSLI